MITLRVLHAFGIVALATLALLSSACAHGKAAVVFSGLPHRVIGSSSITRTPSTLGIVSAQPAEEAGVAIDVSGIGDRTTGWGITSDDIFDPKALPTGAYRKVTLIGRSESGDRITTTTTLMDQGDSLLLSADFSAIGAETVTVRFFHNDRLVEEVLGYDGSGIEISEAAETKNEFYRYRRNGSLKSCTIVTTSAVAANVVGGALHHIDQIEVSPEGETIPLLSLDSVEVRFRGLPQVTISEEPVFFLINDQEYRAVDRGSQLGRLAAVVSKIDDVPSICPANESLSN